MCLLIQCTDRSQHHFWRIPAESTYSESKHEATVDKQKAGYTRNLTALESQKYRSMKYQTTLRNCCSLKETSEIWQVNATHDPGFSSAINTFTMCLYNWVYRQWESGFSLILDIVNNVNVLILDIEDYVREGPCF